MSESVTYLGNFDTRDDLGDRIKGYESRFTSDTVYDNEPLIARIDGRAFRSFTRGLSKPVDPIIQNAMIKTTEHLVKRFKPRVGYTQSDEITLVWDAIESPTTRDFGGKVQKLASVLAGETTAKFMHVLSDRPFLQDRLPHFDARVFSVPSQSEATNALLWRVLDARRNGISSAARSMMSAKKMHRQSSRDLLRTMLDDHGVDYYETFNAHLVSGTLIIPRTVRESLQESDWLSIPEEYRPPIDTVYDRTRMIQSELSPRDGYDTLHEVLWG